jgi:hypothetical protein
VRVQAGGVWPKRLEGKAAVAAYMRGYPDHIDLHDFPHVEIHQTVAPETIVVEMRGVGRLVDSGGPFDMSYIAVVTFKGGLIARYRDYWTARPAGLRHRLRRERPMSTSEKFTLVIGATGTTGSRVAARLAAGGRHVKAAGRRGAPVDGARPVRFDWDYPSSFEGALDGVDRVYLIPPLGSRVSS